MVFISQQFRDSGKCAYLLLGSLKAPGSTEDWLEAGKDLLDNWVAVWELEEPLEALEELNGHF